MTRVFFELWRRGATVEQTVPEKGNAVKLGCRASDGGDSIEHRPVEP